MKRNVVSNYSDSLIFSRDKLELEIVMCARNLISARTIEQHRDADNKFSAYSFRLRELKCL